jgi:aminopeptidase N
MRMPLIEILLLASAVAPLRPVGAQRQVTAAPPDVRRCELLIRPDLPSGRLRLTATLEIANPAGEREFTFFLAAWYDSIAVRGRAGPAAVTRDGDVVTVRVGRSPLHEQLVFRLSGKPGKSAGDDRPVIADSSIYLLWSDRFYPVDFDDWAIVAVQLEVPRGFRVLAPGRRVLSTNRGAMHVEKYETSEPIRAASIIADARWVETERTIAGRRMRTLLHPSSQGYAEQIFRSSADVLAFYTSRFGRYAFDQFTFATVEGIFARRAVAGGVIYNSRFLADELRTTGHDAHETALLWWFYTIAGRGPGSYQWTEGFGDYAEMLYDDARGLPVPTDFESYRRGYLRMAGTPDEPPITAPRGPLAENFVHGRLPWVMHVLRFAVGDSAFDRGVRLLFDRWRFRSFTLEEFVATLAEGTGQHLDWWQHEWLERGGVPELSWHADITPDSGGYRVAVSLRQTGALYHLPLEIGIEFADGLKVERVQLDDRTREVRFWSASEPTRVVIDPQRWLLARIIAK